jgi:hypothetical protein
MLDITTWTNITARQVPIRQGMTSVVRLNVEMVMTVAKRILGRVTASSVARSIVVRSSGVRNRTVVAAHSRVLKFFSLVNVEVERLL